MRAGNAPPAITRNTRGREVVARQRLDGGAGTVLADRLAAAMGAGVRSVFPGKIEHLGSRSKAYRNRRAFSMDRRRLAGMR